MNKRRHRTHTLIPLLPKGVRTVELRMKVMLGRDDNMDRDRCLKVEHHRAPTSQALRVPAVHKFHV